MPTASLKHCTHQVPMNAVLGLDNNHLPWPAAINNDLDLLTRFQLECRKICLQIFAAPSSLLANDCGISFENLHGLQELSTTSLAMLSYPPVISPEEDDVGHIAHTDVGSLTLLFTSMPGLEVYLKMTSSWTPVDPRQGSILVNVGNTLSFMSGLRFKSCLHRVTPIATTPRSSLAFFQRPELTG